jgi:putative sporulation protein YtaF
MLLLCLLSAAVCTDAFFAAVGCSMSGINIPKRCALLVSAIGTAFLGISLLGAQMLAQVLPEAICRYGGCLIIALLGGVQLCKGLCREMLRRRKSHCLHWRGLGMVLELCLDETRADADGSKTLSMGESAAYAVALSIDSLASGLGAGITGKSIFPCLLLTLILGFAATVTGSRLGRVWRKKQSCEWLGGLLLLLIALLRLL